MLKGKVFPWKWNEPPNERQFTLMVAVLIVAILAVFLFVPRLSGG